MDAIIKQAVKDELSAIEKNNTRNNQSSSQSNQVETSQSSNRTVNRLSGLIARIGHRKSDDHSQRKRKSAVIKEHRIQVRWHHYDKTSRKYLPVRQKNGGGNRFVEYLSSNPPTLDDILNRASRLYFPGGKNKFAGQLVNLKKVITDSSGEVIVTFPEAGTVSDYLNANGMYPSSTYFCLRTEDDDEDNDFPSPSLHLNESESEAVDSFLDHVDDEDPFPSFFEDDAIINAPRTVTCEVCFTTNKFGEPCLRCLQNEEYAQSLLCDQKFDKANTEPEVEIVESDSIVDLDQIRAQRVAYLTRETQNIATESVETEPGASLHHNPQDISPTQPKDCKVLKVRRSFIQKDMISHFKDNSCMNIQLTFTIINDMGKAELGAGEGVTREVFVLETLCKCNDGRRERMCPFCWT